MSALPQPEGPDSQVYDDLPLMAVTVFLEAESEPDEGKAGVAWVIRNRTDYGKRRLREVIVAPWQFSCWNEDYRKQRTARLIAPDPEQWDRSWRAACGAYWRLIADPTGGATHYLNVELTRQIRPGHDLPDWYRADQVTARIGRHEFLT